jgi:DNA replication licensing factor MCM3
LATAHAKARLSNKIEASDAEAAHEILRFALFKEVLKPERRKKRKLNSGMAVDGSDEEEEDGEGSDDEEAEPNKRMEMPNGTGTGTRTGSSTRGRTPTASAPTVVNGQTGTNQRVAVGAKPKDDGFGQPDEDVNMTIDEEDSQQDAIAPQRLTLFRNLLGTLWANEYPEDEAVPFEMILEGVNRNLEAAHIFSRDEAIAAIEKMDKQVMISDDIVYKI